MQLHDVVPFYVPVKPKRIGRGGKRGKTSGKGGKGQTARAGATPRPEMRDFIKKLPKLRGHGVNRARTVYAERPSAQVVNLSVIATHFVDGDKVTPRILATKGLVPARAGKAPMIKILGTGDIAIKLTFEKCDVSATAKAKIEKAGGTIVPTI
jgi:large subunit ribosomal protein L15